MMRGGPFDVVMCHFCHRYKRGRMDVCCLTVREFCISDRRCLNPSLSLNCHSLKQKLFLAPSATCQKVRQLNQSLIAPKKMQHINASTTCELDGENISKAWTEKVSCVCGHRQRLEHKSHKRQPRTTGTCLGKLRGRRPLQILNRQGSGIYAFHFYTVLLSDCKAAHLKK